MPTALDSLTDLITSGYQPQKIDEIHDLLKLLGIVLAQVTLLDVATNIVAEPKDRVSAARALLAFTKESPESIQERLRRSPFSDLTVGDLQTIVQEIKSGKTDIHAIIQDVKSHGRI